MTMDQTAVTLLGTMVIVAVGSGVTAQGLLRSRLGIGSGPAGVAVAAYLYNVFNGMPWTMLVAAIKFVGRIGVKIGRR
jgi:hypothetical protein